MALRVVEAGGGQGNWRTGDQAMGGMRYLSEAECYRKNVINIGQHFFHRSVSQGI